MMGNNCGEDAEEEASSALKELEKYRAMDVSHSSGRVLGSMYTAPEDIAVRAHSMFIEANLGNLGLYKGTAAMADKIRSIIYSIVNADRKGDMIFTSGGTEANIDALWIARKTGCGYVIYGSNAHFSIRKAADLLGLTPIEVECNERHVLDPNKVKEALSSVNGRCAVVATAGTTELGLIDPIAGLSEVCKAHEAFLHVDAAYGGFMIPALRDLGLIKGDSRFGFELDGVLSVTLDPHKVMGATTPLGAMVLRNGRELEHIRFPAPYLSNGECLGLLGTRHSAAVGAFYALWQRMGWEGYKGKVSEAMAQTQYIVSLLKESGIELVTEPVMNIVGIRVKGVKGVYRELKRMGWFPSLIGTVEGLRVVVFPHHTKPILERFVDDLKTAMRTDRG